MKQTIIHKKHMPRNDEHKRCSKCGQNKIPFKLGVCMCGHQVGDIRLVRDPYRFAQTQYNVEKHDTGL